MLFKMWELGLKIRGNSLKVQTWSLLSRKCSFDRFQMWVRNVQKFSDFNVLSWCKSSPFFFMHSQIFSWCARTIWWQKLWIDLWWISKKKLLIGFNQNCFLSVLKCILLPFKVKVKKQFNLVIGILFERFETIQCKTSIWIIQ